MIQLRGMFGFGLMATLAMVAAGVHGDAQSSDEPASSEAKPAALEPIPEAAPLPDSPPQLIDGRWHCVVGGQRWVRPRPDEWVLDDCVVFSKPSPVAQAAATELPIEAAAKLAPPQRFHYECVIRNGRKVGCRLVPD